jgi:hypothetical protein
MTNTSKLGKVKKVRLIPRKQIFNDDCYFYLWEIGKNLTDSLLKKGVSATPEEVPHRCTQIIFQCRGDRSGPVFGERDNHENGEDAGQKLYQI